MSSYEKNAELTVHAANRYQYSMDDYAQLKVALATAEGQVQKFSKGQRDTSVNGSSLAKEAANDLGIKVNGTDVTMSYPEVTVDRVGSMVQVQFGDKAMSSIVANSQLAISKIAAPSKMTFKPAAVKYEISADDFSSLGNTLQGLYTPGSIYRTTTNTSGDYKLGPVTNEALYDMMGCFPLRDGGASVKEKTISIYKLDNGFSVKLGKSKLFVLTLAEPIYKNNEDVFVRVLGPDSDWSSFKTKIGKGLGYNNDYQDFMYEVCDVNGNTIQVPERNVMERLMPAATDPTVRTSHF